jgi:hypothetical protein|tara:strand:- start:400 stop:699 length:300 start_codon:yes stop_codon:yes gene_type:complete
MTVYAIQEVKGRNLLPAAEFGEVQFLLPATSNIMFAPAPTVNRLRYALKDFTEDDYLLLIGDPLAIGVATAVANQHARKIKFLKWDNRQYKYYPVEVEL